MLGPLGGWMEEETASPVHRFSLPLRHRLLWAWTSIHQEVLEASRARAWEAEGVVSPIPDLRVGLRAGAVNSC